MEYIVSSLMKDKYLFGIKKGNNIYISSLMNNHLTASKKEEEYIKSNLAIADMDNIDSLYLQLSNMSTEDFQTFINFASKVVSEQLNLPFDFSKQSNAIGETNEEIEERKQRLYKNRSQG